jgi:hypothetical protein
MRRNAGKEGVSLICALSLNAVAQIRAGIEGFSLQKKSRISTLDLSLRRG